LKNGENKSPVVNEIKPSTAAKSSPESSVEPPSKKSKISSSTSEMPKITSFAERIKAKKIINDDKPGKKLGDSIIDEIDSSFEKEKENFESVKKTNGSKPPAQKSSKKAVPKKNNQIVSSSEDETPSENLATKKTKSQPKSSSSQKKKAIHISSSDDEISESDSSSSSETDDDETLDNSSM